MGKLLFQSMFLMIVSCGLITAELVIPQFSPDNIAEEFPAILASSNATIDKFRTLLRDKCINVAGEEKGQEAFNEITMGVMTLGECAMGLMNFTAIKDEIDEASPRGELDVVFGKYCSKRPEAMKCIEDFNDKLIPCLEPEERQNQKVFMRIITSLLNFICHKGGDQIALFIAEKGPECLQSKSDDIQNCLNSTFSGYVPKEGIENVESLPKFVMSEKQCADIERLEVCVVTHLETCSEITPANIMESMFRFIKNETICRNVPTSEKHEQTGGAQATGLSAMIFSTTFALFIFISKWMQQ